MRAAAILRGAASLALFVAFGLGALAISPLMLALKRPEKRQPVVRAAWRLALWSFCAVRLIRIDRTALPAIRGSVIAANHPSLIDVLILTALLPRTMYVAKSALLSNPWLAAIVRATALPDDARLPAAAAEWLAKGWNVLIFPEGTRTPPDGTVGRLHRGAAQLALRAGAPLVGVRIDVSRRILGKGQPPWDMGAERVDYSFAARRISADAGCGQPLRSAAMAATAELAGFLRQQSRVRHCVPEMRTKAENGRIAGQ